MRMPRSLVAAVAVAAGCGDVDRCERGDPGVVCQVAGTGEYAFGEDGQPALDTAFYLPSQARRGPDGRIYVTDFNNQRVRAIGADGKVVTIAGTGWHGFSTPGGPAVDSPLENPIDFDFLPSGEMVLIGYHEPRVLVIDAQGLIQVIAGTGDLGVNGNEGDGGPALQAQFIELTGVAVGPDGAVYVADDVAHRVRVIRDGVVDTVAGFGVAAFLGDGGPAVVAALSRPTGLAVDAAGNLYIADYGNGAIRRVDPDGIITTVAGTGVRGYGGDGGPATAAGLGGPDGVAVAADGSIYISDRDAHRIRRVDPAGTITTLAGTGIEGFTGNGGPAGEATFGFTARISLDGDRLLVADQTNSCVRQIHLNP
jgi:hypothetical protein